MTIIAPWEQANNAAMFAEVGSYYRKPPLWVLLQT